MRETIQQAKRRRVYDYRMPRRRTAVFPVNGQGTLVYTVRKKSQFTIYITPDKQKVPKIMDFDSEFSEFEEEQHFDTEYYISLTVGDHFARFKLKMHKDGEEKVLKEDYGKDIGIDPKELVSYTKLVFYALFSLVGFPGI